MTKKTADPKLIIYHKLMNQKVLYHENQTLLSRPVKLPNLLTIKFSAIQANMKINRIQD